MFIFSLRKMSTVLFPILLTSFFDIGDTVVSSWCRGRADPFLRNSNKAESVIQVCAESGTSLFDHWIAIEPQCIQQQVA